MADGTNPQKDNQIPKFASFRPKPKSTSDQVEHRDSDDVLGSRSRHETSGQEASLRHEASQRRRVQRDHHVQERSRSRSKNRHGHHRSRHVKDREHRGSKSSQQYPPEPPAIVAWEESSELYVTDTKGDPNNLIYGTIHRYSIPQYHRFGAGWIIGIPIKSKIDRGLSNEERLVTNERSAHREGPREKYGFAKNERKGVKKLRLRPIKLRDTAIDAGLDFIPLRPSGGLKRKRDYSGSSSSSSSDEGGQNYRSIEGKANQATRPMDPDLQYAPESSECEYEEKISFRLDEATKQQSMALSRKVADEPTNLQAWLELIRHQDTLLGLGNGPERRKITLAERRSTADIKLSMYEKAVDNFPKQAEGRERLLIGMMAEGAKVWETKKQSSKWKAILRENPGMIGLWTKYLNFQQTNLSTFTYEECLGIYRDCLQVLSSAATKTEIDPDRDRLGEVTIYVQLRMTLFIRESGFAELSIAIWQALLETNFFMPSDLEPSLKGLENGVCHEQLLLPFEQFWESETARIGEIGAKGWCHYATHDSTAPESKVLSARLPLDDRDLFKSWVEAEQLRAANSRDPLRTTEEVEEDDPYSVILFSDVKNCVLHFSSRECRKALLDAFLSFCTLPPLSTHNLDRHGLSWWTDPFVRNEILEHSNAKSSNWVSREHSNHGQDRRPSDLGVKSMEQSCSTAQGDTFLSFQHNFPTSTETLFSTKELWFSAYDTWEDSYPQDTGPVKLEFVRRALRSLVAVGAGGDDLAEYYLSFEWKNSPESVKKIAKGLLKKRPSSLRLYNAYALIEFRSGNITAANHVFVTALSMSKTFSESDQLDKILLWRTWAWELLYSGDYTAALKLLLAVPDDKIRDDLLVRHAADDSKITHASSTALLKAQRALDQHSHLLIQGHTIHAILYHECRTLLTYLSHSRTLSTALPILDSILPTLTTAHYAHSASALEQTHLARAKLLHYHATHVRNYRPALLREKLSESVALFPNNTIFLSLFASNESRSRLDDRVRSLTSNILLKISEEQEEPSITALFFLIQTELRRSPTLGSTKASIIATFERAVATETGRSSASLWKSYLLYLLSCLERGEGEEDKGKRAKEVFYRGMRSVPWAKRFIMLAFETRLRDVMGEEELRVVWNVLGEKELRIFVDLEEAFEARDERKKAERTVVEGEGEGEESSD